MNKKCIYKEHNRVKTAKLSHKIKNTSSNNIMNIKQEKAFINSIVKDYKENLNTIKQDLTHYYKKTSKRENNIRNYIYNLNNFINTDIEKSKQDTELLFSQIMLSINIILSKIQYEINDKKKDISNRTKIRLMDSNFTHKQLLENKIRDQECFMKVLHNFTSQIVKIQDNYIKSKCQITNLTAINTGIKEKINKAKDIKKNLINEMTNIKSVINDVKKEIYLIHNNNSIINQKCKLENKILNLSLFNKQQPFNSIKDRSIINNNNTIKDSIISTKNNSLNLSNRLKSKNDLNINQLKKEKSSINVINHLLKIKNNLAKKNKEYKLFLCLNSNNNNVIKNYLYSIVENLKKDSKDISKKNNNNNYYINIQKSNFLLYMDKDKRRRFIDYLVKDKLILDVVKKDSMPLFKINF